MRNSTSRPWRRRVPMGGAAMALALLLLPGGAAVTYAAEAGADTNTLTSADVAAFLDGIVPYAIRSGDIAGATVSVVANGQIIFAKGYGFADMRTRRPVSADRTLFRPGSISKTFTWTAVMQLVQAGKLDLDRDVNDYLDFKIPGEVRQAHHPAQPDDAYPGIRGHDRRRLRASRRSDLVPYREYLVKHLPAQIFPPGKVVAYSNYGAMLAGYIVQRVSGEPSTSTSRVTSSSRSA